MTSSSVPHQESWHDARQRRHFDSVQPQQQYKPHEFSAEELRVLRQCNRESFYQRCLPLSAVLMTGVHFAVKKGILKSHPQFGSTLKVAGAGIVGFILGKISYTSTYTERLMQLPNSKYAEMLRRRKGQTSEEHAESKFGSSSAVKGYGADEVYTGMNETNPNVDIDSDKNISYSGLDDSQRPSLDDSQSFLEDEEMTKKLPSTTYEELRYKNRQEYEARRAEANKRLYNQPPVYDQQEPIAKSRFESKVDNKPIPAQSTGSEKNKYGDVWDQ